MKQSAEAAAEAAGGPVMSSHVANDEELCGWGVANTEDQLSLVGGFTRPVKTAKNRGHKGGSAVPLGAGQVSWFDVRVLYVRLSGCSVDDDSTPETLRFRSLPRGISCAVEVNGARISPSEEFLLTLRRDRVDSESSEATYVSTDRLRASDSIAFEVLHEEDQLLCGILHRQEVKAGEAGEGFTPSGQSQQISVGWSLECSCTVGGGGCVFLRPKHDYTTPLVHPSMEVCIVGRFNVMPVILTQTVVLTARRRNLRKVALDVIPEADEADRVGAQQSGPLLDAETCSSLVRLHASEDEVVNKSRTGYGSIYDIPMGDLGGYGIGGYGEGEEPEMSWFNAGVRVGVGLGLGMCLGIGIGVGIIVRSYQATTRTFRRSMF